MRTGLRQTTGIMFEGVGVSRDLSGNARLKSSGGGGHRKMKIAMTAHNSDGDQRKKEN